MVDRAVVDIPTLKIEVRLPRLYGLRLRVVGWLMSMAGVVAGSLMTIDIVNADEAERWTPEG